MRTRPASRSSPSTGSSPPTAITAGSTTRPCACSTTTASRCSGRASSSTSPSRSAPRSDSRDAEARYRALVEHIPAVVYTETPRRRPGAVLHQPAGRAGLRLDRRRVAVDARTSGSTASIPTTCEAVLEVDRRSNETHEPYSMDYRFRHRDGRWMWVRDEAMFLPEPEGEGYWQGFLLDITERKEAEVALARGRAEVPDDRRAEPGDLLHAGDRPRRSRRSRIRRTSPPGTPTCSGTRWPRSRLTRPCGAGSCTPTTGSGSSRPTPRATGAKATTTSRSSTG